MRYPPMGAVQQPSVIESPSGNTVHAVPAGGRARQVGHTSIGHAVPRTVRDAAVRWRAPAADRKPTGAAAPPLPRPPVPPPAPPLPVSGAPADPVTQPEP